MKPVAAALAVLAAGCNAILGIEEPSLSSVAGDGPPALVTTRYVTSGLKVGATGTEAGGFGFNLDGRRASENQLGLFFAGLPSVFRIDAELDAGIQAGQLITLHALRAPALDEAPVATWQVYEGTPVTSPDFSGNGSFTVAATTPRDEIVSGTIHGGVFRGGPAQKVSLQISFVSRHQTFQLPLIAARIEATVGADGCLAGRLGGGIVKVVAMNVVVPALVDELNGRIGDDGSCRQDINACSPDNRTLLQLLDTNGDGLISLAEVTGNTALMQAFAPDVDLLDGTGKLGQDGTNDSISMAFGFVCARAAFTP